MIDKDTNDKSDKTIEDEPPPYSRRQPSTSSNTGGGRNRLRSNHGSPTTAIGPGSRFIAPVPERGENNTSGSGSQPLPPVPSPRLVISPAEYQNYPSTSEGRNPSFVDLAYEKPDSPKAGLMQGGYTMSHGDLMGLPNDSGTVVASGSAYPQTTMGIVPRSPTTASKKGTETLILMGTGTSGMWMNHIVVATKTEPIQGVYHVDPNLEVMDYATQRRLATVGSGKSHSRNNSAASVASKDDKKKKKQDLSWHPSTAPSSCNAFFETKSGNMEILLSIGGSGSHIASRANVDIRNKHGKTNLKLMDVGQGRQINLEVFSVEGNIEVFLPRSFSGLLHVHTDGDITLLPSVAAAMEVVSARDDDALVMIAPAIKVRAPSPTASSSSSPRIRTSDPMPSSSFMPGGFSNFLHPHMGSKAAAYEGDYANITSTSGNIIVGFVGEDQLEEKSGGMWKKFVSLFKGSRSNSA